MTKNEQQLFYLGREVNLALPFSTLRPRDKDIKIAASKLKISQKLAWRAWTTFTWGES